MSNGHFPVSKGAGVTPAVTPPLESILDRAQALFQAVDLVPGCPYSFSTPPEEVLSGPAVSGRGARAPADLGIIGISEPTYGPQEVNYYYGVFCQSRGSTSQKVLFSDQRSLKPLGLTGGKRTEIKGFSYDSRQRFILRTSEIDWEYYPFVYFLTLTCPGDLCDSDRRAVLRVLRDHGCAGVWRMERGEKGEKLHYHLLVGSLSFWGSSSDVKSVSYLVKKIIFQRYKSVYDSIVDLHDRTNKLKGLWINCVFIYALKKYENVLEYCLKYCVKDSAAAETDGRVWGVFGDPKKAEFVKTDISVKDFEGLLDQEVKGFETYMRKKKRIDNLGYYKMGIKRATKRVLKFS